MSEFDAALQRITEDLNAGDKTVKADWRIIFKSLVGVDDVETIRNVQHFIEEKFSFKIQDGAEGVAYYGMTGANAYTLDTPVYGERESVFLGNR